MAKNLEINSFIFHEHLAIVFGLKSKTSLLFKTAMHANRRRNFCIRNLGIKH